MEPKKHNASEEKQPDTTSTPLKKVEEIGGRQGLEPTRYGDWENKGKCTDF